MWIMVQHHFFRKGAGIFTFKKVDTSRMVDKDLSPISQLVAQVKDVSYEYLIRVHVDQRAVEKPKKSHAGVRVCTAGKIGIDLGEDPRNSEHFLEKWPTTNEWLGITITRGAVCRFAFRYMQLWVLPMYKDHYALCLAYQVELADDTSIKIPDELKPMLTSKKPHADDVAKAALERFMRAEGIRHHSIFPFPGWEDKIWKGRS